MSSIPSVAVSIDHDLAASSAGLSFEPVEDDLADMSLSDLRLGLSPEQTSKLNTAVQDIVQQLLSDKGLLPNLDVSDDQLRSRPVAINNCSTIDQSQLMDVDMPPEPVGSTVSVQTSSDDIVEVDQEVIPTSANVIEDSIEIMEEEESGNNNNNNNRFGIC